MLQENYEDSIKQIGSFRTVSDELTVILLDSVGFCVLYCWHTSSFSLLNMVILWYNRYRDSGKYTTTSSDHQILKKA